MHSALLRELGSVIVKAVLFLPSRLEWADRATPAFLFLYQLKASGRDLLRIGRRLCRMHV